MRYRPNCKPLRETKITEVNYLGRYQIGSKCKGSEEKAGIYFHRISAIQMDVSTSVPKKRDDSRFKLSRLLILDSLLLCSRIQILAKKQNRFWIHEFPPKTYPGKYLNQCLQYIENTSWKVLAYGIYARVVDVSEILLVRCAHSFDF